MSTIGSVGGSSAAARPQRPDPSQIADKVFSKVDTKKQGYIDKAELQSAVDNLATNSKTAGSSKTDTASGVDALFKKIDSDGDGKITKSELTDGIKKLGDALDSQFNSARVAGGKAAKPAGGPPPPPPPQGGGSTGADSSTATASAAKTFDKADTNQDGKVSVQERLAYDSTKEASASSDSQVQNASRQAERIGLQLVQAYGRGEQSVSQADTGSSISVTV